jgi:cation-transporting ATPase 13A1
MTIMGIFGTAYYFCYSSARPQKYLSPVRPSSTIFELPFLISLLAQITLHISTMDYALHQIGIHYSSQLELEVDNDLEFTPTFLNTVIFLI